MILPPRGAPAESASVAEAGTQPELDLTVLLLQAIELQRQGGGQARHPELTSDRKYNAQHILRIARTASLPEIRVLVLASEIREKGLAFLKAGDLEAGADWLREARRIYSEAALSREPRLSANSFQYPAEAFLQYKAGEYSRAEASLLQAISLCHALRDDYGHQVEVRRIHLTRNVVRAKARGGSPKEALKLATLLLGYLEGREAECPLRKLRMSSAPDPLLREERWALVGQVLAEIALLATRRDSTSLDPLSAAAGLRVAYDRDGSVGEFAQVHAWLAARRAMLEGDARGFLTHGIVFFAGGQGYLSRAWHELTLDLMNLSEEIREEPAFIQAR
jgi:hypothetical protein